MKLLFLRGRVPQDRPKKEIMWNSLHENPDLWENIACGTAETVEILYWGGDRHVKYEEDKWIKWVKSFKNYRPDFEPDVIFARGGFEEYHSILRKFPNSVQIYYGAGARFLPLKGYTKFDITLQDSPERFAKATQAFPKINHVHWVKPAVDHFFSPQPGKKEYDIAYVANGTQARIKRIPWVYKTAPSDLKVLHLGLKSPYTPPPNIKCRRVVKEQMAKWLSKCHIGIIPYKEIDSAPRVVPEMLACGLPVLALKGCHLNPRTFYAQGECFGRIQDKNTFWDTAKGMLKQIKEDEYGNITTRVSEFYKENISLQLCCEKLRCLIENTIRNKAA